MHPVSGRRFREPTLPRRAPVSRYPYHLAYLVADDEIHVLPVAHDHRRPTYWTGRASRTAVNRARARSSPAPQPAATAPNVIGTSTTLTSGPAAMLQRTAPGRCGGRTNATPPSGH